MTSIVEKSLQALAREVAQLASADESKNSLRLLKALGWFREPQCAGAASNRTWHAPADRDEFAVPEGRARVGVWERKAGTSAFARCPGLSSQWHWWANVSVLPPKRRARRVLLLGESVARGYLYDPQLTPAQILERMLRAERGQDEIEVLDLARTNLNLRQLEILTRTALVLEPDIVVVFAGNNWWPVALDVEALASPDILAAMHADGVAGVKRALEGKRDALVRAAVREISAHCRHAGVPLVWIVPEFNLGDWKDPITNAPRLPDRANACWTLHRDEARRALDANDPISAAAHARRMTELDGGTTVTGFYLLADCCARTGDVDGTRENLEAARDSQVWIPWPKSPRCYGTVQQIIRDHACATGAAAVDLPAVFRECLEGGVPDRRLFLDYCHLNVRGLHVAMAATAAVILQRLDAPRETWHALAAKCEAPPGSVEAEGAFLAAIHNAHYFQSADLVGSLCRQAVGVSDELVTALCEFVDVQARRTPMWMCSAAERLAGMPLPSVRSYLLRANTPYLDVALLRTVADVLTSRGHRIHEQLERTWIDEHGVDVQDVDLLDDYYYSSSTHEFAQVGPWEWRDSMTAGRRFYEAYSDRSKFVFVGRRGCGVCLYLACRVPGARESAPIRISINGSEQYVGEVSRSWGRIDVCVPGEMVCDGINDVVIQWPAADSEVASEGARAMENQLLSMRIPAFYPSFGQIHSFVASSAANQSWH